MQSKITVGLPRMHLEAGEKREFLPDFMEKLHRFGYEIVLEHNYGAGMGFSEEDYRKTAPDLRFASLDEVYQKDIVIVLRYPGDKLVSSMRRGACLMSMIGADPTRVIEQVTAHHDTPVVWLPTGNKNVSSKNHSRTVDARIKTLLKACGLV